MARIIGGAHNLTIYLVKEQFRSVNDLLRSNSNTTSFRIGAPQLGELVVHRTAAKIPRWASFFEGYVDVDQLGKVESARAVLAVPAAGRLFVVSFGNGRFILRPESYEERFGLRVALNCIAEGRVRSIDKRTFDAIARHSLEQASRDATTSDFGFDVEQDLLRAVTGTPSDTSLGHRMYGMDALSVAVKICMADLPALLERYYEKHNEKTYRKSYPWIDQIAEVMDKSQHERLDQLLFDRIATGARERIWMAVPEVVPWERVGGFKYSQGSRSAEHYDINLEDFLASLPDPTSLTKDSFSHRYVYCIDTEGTLLDKWQAYRCLYCELDHDSDSYLLSGGRWYRVTRDFVQDVNQAYERIPKFKKPLPSYNDKTETDYNMRVARESPKEYALMDNKKKIAYGGGRGQVEFCDLYTKSNDIIHVKRYANSSVLSHLFAQGLISGELFRTDSSFREKVNGKLPASHRFDDPNRTPRTGEYQIVFAVVSDAPGELVIPFFSRLNMKHSARRLGGYGFRVAKLKIEVAPELSKLKVYKKAARSTKRRS